MAKLNIFFRILFFTVLVWGWTYIFVRHIEPVFAGGIIYLGGGTAFAATVVFTAWVLSSTATKLLVVLDACREAWFKASFLATLCFATYLVFLSVNAPADIPPPVIGWYRSILWFGLSAAWPVLDIALCVGAARNIGAHGNGEK